MNLREQVSTDLRNYLSQYKDIKKGIRISSLKMGVHAKTIRRLLEKENTPTYLTLYKVYREVLDVQNDSILLQMVPEVVKQELVKDNPKDVLGDIQFKTEVEEEILADRVFMDIYFLACCGPLTRELIQFKFGEYGLSTVSKMLKSNVLAVDDGGRFIQGSNQANLSPTTIKRVGLFLVDKYFSPESCEERGKNFCGVYVEGLTPEGYNEWLKVDYDSYYKKVELSKKYKDPNGIKAFTYMATDTMTEVGHNQLRDNL